MTLALVTLGLLASCGDTGGLGGVSMTLPGFIRQAVISNGTLTATLTAARRADGELVLSDEPLTINGDSVQGEFSVPPDAYDITITFIITEPFATYTQEINVEQNNTAEVTFGGYGVSGEAGAFLDLRVDSDSDSITDLQELYAGMDPTLEACAEECGCNMVPIGNLACIDRYEATVYASSDCTGTRYGESTDDYPAGFPDIVESSGCQGTCAGESTQSETFALYACPVVGVIPSRYITWFQARRACQNAGKRLCTGTKWDNACGCTGSGPDPCDEYCNWNTEEFENSYWTCGAASSVTESPCNLSTYPFEVSQTGANQDCVTMRAAMDITGNLFEWLENLGSSSPYLQEDCVTDPGEWPMASMTEALDVIGFRCCK